MAREIFTVRVGDYEYDVEADTEAEALAAANAQAAAAPSEAPVDAGAAPTTQGPAQAPADPAVAPAGTPTGQPTAPNFAAEETEGQFGDADKPTEVNSKFAPEVESQYAQLLKTGTTAQIMSFLAANNKLGTDAAAMAKYVAARDAGHPVRATVSYAVPKVQTTTADAAVRGALDTVTFGALPKIGAAVGAVEAGLQGQNMGDAYNRVLDENNAVVAADEEDHGTARIVGQLAGGFILPAGIENVGITAGRAAIRANKALPAIERLAAGRRAAARAITQRLAVVGGGTGALHGALSADNLPDAVAGALSEGAFGAATGGALGLVAQRAGARGIAKRAAQATSDEVRVAQAADRQNIDLIRADVSGPGTKNLSEGVVKLPFGAGPLVKASTNTIEQVERARDNLVDQIGTALSPESLGNTVVEGARKWRKSSKLAISKLYRNAETLADGIEINPQNTLDEVQGQINELANTPGGSPVLPYLREMAEDLENKTFSVTDLRRMRTTMRAKFITDNLDRTDVERRVDSIMNQVSRDITNDLTHQGAGDASDAFDAADKAYRGYRQIADEVVAPLVGFKTAPRSGEAVARTLRADLQSNQARAAKLIRTLPDEERNNVVASLIGGLGHGGKQSDAQFSLDRFLTNWNDIGETAKSAFFGLEARAALNDLATVSKAAQKTKAFANRSNTGTAAGVAGSFGMIGTAVLSGGGTLASSLVTAAGQYGLARWLASPKFARALARLPKDASKQEQVFLERIARIARAEPALADDMTRLSQVIRGQKPVAAPGVSTTPTRTPGEVYTTDEDQLDREQAAYEEQEAANAAAAAAPDPTVYPEDEGNFAGGYPAQQDQ